MSHYYGGGAGGPPPPQGFERGRQIRQEPPARQHHGYDRSRSRDRSARSSRPRTTIVQTNFFRLSHMRETGRGEWQVYHVTILRGRQKRDENGQRLAPLDPLPVLPSSREEIRVEARMTREGTACEMNLEPGSNVLSRRILVELQTRLDADHGAFFAGDGAATAYAPQHYKQIFDREDLLAAQNTEANQTTEDGPAGLEEQIDTKTSPEVQKPSQTFQVSVKAKCEKDDEDSHLEKNDYFLVRIRFTHAIIFRVDNQNRLRPIDAAMESMQSLNQALNTIIWNSRLSKMVAWGRSPRALYIPERELWNTPGRIKQLLGTDLQKLYFTHGRRDSSLPDFCPLIGLLTIVQLCANGNSFAMLEDDLKFFYRDKKFQEQNQPPEPVPVLDPRRRTIAGVLLGNLNAVVADPDKQRSIENALRDINFHVVYDRSLSEGKWSKERRDRGWSEEKLVKLRRFSKKNERMAQSDGTEAPTIIWDPAEFTFTREALKDEQGNVTREAVTHTVETYYREQYGIRLKYPNMPLVGVTNRGSKRIDHFPVELLYQAFGRKGHFDEQTQHALAFNDNFAGAQKIQLIQSLASMVDYLERASGLTLPDLLEQFNLSIAKEPLQVEAKLLEWPELLFGNDRRTSPSDGSFNLKGTKFLCPADLSSFAVIDCCNGASTEPMTQLLSVTKAHGINLPSDLNLVDVLPHVTVKVSNENNFEELCWAFENAVKRAREYYLFDCSAAFREKKIWFKSQVRHPKHGSNHECLVIAAPRPRGNILIGVMLRGKDEWCTHSWGTDDEEVKARLQVRVQVVTDGRHLVVDPFDFQYSAGQRCYEANVGGKWIEVKLVDHIFVDKRGRELQPTDSVRPYVAVDIKDVECPCIVFVYIRTYATQSYSAVKFLAQFVHGVQSQCMVQEKYARQRNKDQYCSNIALKLNTKLANNFNIGQAWSIYGSKGIKWIKWLEPVPTLVFGYCVSKEQAGDRRMVIAATACLSNGMHMGQIIRLIRNDGSANKSMIVERDVMAGITKSLATLYYLGNNRTKPLRVLVYRDGSSEGDFDALLRKEVAGIRQGFFEFEKQFGDSCKIEACQSGCLFCTPLITFIVCGNQHGVKITPTAANPGAKKAANVQSGTCVDGEIMPFRDGLNLASGSCIEGSLIPVEKSHVPKSLHIFEVEGNGYDFLLTAQGGLKGTSKPVFYRCILNENAIWKPLHGHADATPLDKQTLQIVTYLMSYEYGTATKTVRSVPVVCYSRRLANTAVGYLSYMDRNRHLKEMKSGLLVRVDGSLSPEDSEEPGKHAATTELLPKFSPFSPEHDLPQEPFRSNISG